MTLPLLIAVSLLFHGSPAFQENTSVRFDKTVHDFGDFGINDGSRSHTFTLTNNSDKPIVIQTVISSCGCTVPEWTKEPIPPGKQGTVTATFLNNQGPYPFDKLLSVYITGYTNPFTLHIRGVVHQKAFSVEDTHPVLMETLRLRKSELELGQIKQGTEKTDSVEVINTGKQPLLLRFKTHDGNVKVYANPGKLNPGEKGYIVYTIDTRVKEEWGNVIYPVQVVINDKVNPVHSLTVKGSIKINTSSMTREQKEKGPIPQLDKSAYEFSEKKIGSSIETRFSMTNKGKGPLVIFKADFSHPGIKAEFPTTVNPGETVSVLVSIPKTDTPGEVIYTVSLTTNAPSRPTINLLIYGKIIK